MADTPRLTEAVAASAELGKSSAPATRPRGVGERDLVC